MKLDLKKVAWAPVAFYQPTTPPCGHRLHGFGGQCCIHPAKDPSTSWMLASESLLLVPSVVWPGPMKGCALEDVQSACLPAAKHRLCVGSFHALAWHKRVVWTHVFVEVQKTASAWSCKLMVYCCGAQLKQPMKTASLQGCGYRGGYQCLVGLHGPHELRNSCFDCQLPA